MTTYEFTENEPTTARGRLLKAQAEARAGGVKIQSLQKVRAVAMRLTEARQKRNAKEELVGIVTVARMEALIPPVGAIDAEVEIEAEESWDVVTELERGLKPALNQLVDTIIAEHAAQLERRKEGETQVVVDPAGSPKKKDIRENVPQ